MYHSTRVPDCWFGLGSYRSMGRECDGGVHIEARIRAEGEAIVLNCESFDGIRQWNTDARIGGGKDVRGGCLRRGICRTCDSRAW